MNAAEPASTPRRRLPRLSIGSILWMMLVIGILLTWQIDRMRLVAELEDQPSLSANWSAGEATGSPDTFQAGDIPTAWASSSPDGQKEWLDLRYDRAVKPSAIEVHETYNPGALYKIGVFDEFGREHIVWRGTDPTPPGTGKGVSKIKIQTSFATSRVKIYLDSPKVPGWNEVDAVALIDSRGKTQWAKSAKASSTFASGYSGAPFVISGGSMPMPGPAVPTIIIEQEPETELQIP